MLYIYVIIYINWFMLHCFFDIAELLQKFVLRQLCCFCLFYAMFTCFINLDVKVFILLQEDQVIHVLF